MKKGASEEEIKDAYKKVKRLKDGERGRNTEKKGIYIYIYVYNYIYIEREKEIERERRVREKEKERERKRKEEKVLIER